MTFSSLRANDLIWSYVVNSYLKGKGPSAFDLLHWNADSTNLPGPMYTWYLRNAYLENNLCKPGRTVQCRPISMHRVKTISFPGIPLMPAVTCSRATRPLCWARADTLRE